MNTGLIEQILQLTEQLSHEDKIVVVRGVTTQLLADFPTAATLPASDETWTDEELAELLSQPNNPLTTREIVERGLTGGWADMGITDSVEWVLEQRRKREDQLKW